MIRCLLDGQPNNAVSIHPISYIHCTDHLLRQAANMWKKTSKGRPSSVKLIVKTKSIQKYCKETGMTYETKMDTRNDDKYVVRFASTGRLKERGS